MKQYLYPALFGLFGVAMAIGITAQTHHRSSSRKTSESLDLEVDLGEIIETLPKLPESTRLAEADVAQFNIDPKVDAAYQWEITVFHHSIDDQGKSVQMVWLANEVVFHRSGYVTFVPDDGQRVYAFPDLIRQIPAYPPPIPLEPIINAPKVIAGHG